MDRWKRTMDNKIKALRQERDRRWIKLLRAKRAYLRACRFVEREERHAELQALEFQDIQVRVPR